MFSGCGGLDLGFQGGFDYRSKRYERLPFDVINAYDSDERCKFTYEMNLGGSLEVLDLAAADVTAFPSADVLLGGFPCQEFAACGPRGGVDSMRGGLFRAMTRYAKHHQPLVVVAENVQHLAYMNGGAELRTIRRSLASAGYSTYVWPVYAPDFGVPQTRRRIFIVGVRKDISAVPQPPAATTSGAHPSIGWAIGDLERVRDETVPNQSQYFKAGLAASGHGQGDERLDKDSPAFTIRANSKSRVQFHYRLPRRLTVRECARIQTFPDDFIFPFAATTAIRQIGNAVPPVLAHGVAQAIASFAKMVDGPVDGGPTCQR